MKRNLNRLMGLLLTIALAIGLMAGMSITALADNTGAYNSYLVTSSDTTTTLPNKVISFNNIDWYIIKDESTALNAGTVTLLAKNCLGASAFGSGSTYKGSTVETWLGTYYSEKFGNNYNDAVVEVTPSNPEGNKARLWLVSEAEIPQNAEYLKCSQATGASYNYWWLRSPGAGGNSAAIVDGEYGRVIGGALTSAVIGVRPALKLNLSSVIFDSESKTFSLKPASTYTDFGGLITNDTEVTISEVSGKTWYVIANDSSTVTLLSKESFGNKAFNSTGAGNDYATSEIKTYVDGLTGEGQPLAGISSVISDLTLIDITTAQGLTETKRKGAGTGWWLRSPGGDYRSAACVDGGSGLVYASGTDVTDTRGVRPALKLNLSSVIFSSESNTFSLKPSHEHNFTYSASGATITATCSAADCTLPESSTGVGDHVATLSLVAPTLTTYGGTGDAAATLDGLNDFNTATGKTIATTDIKYVGRDGTTYAESATAPTDAGKYTAKITVEEKTASLNYEIAKATARTISDVTASQIYTQESVSQSVAGKMPDDAGTLTYSKGTATTTGSVTVSEFEVNATSGAVTATLSGGAAGDTVTLPVTISSTNYLDSTVKVVITLKTNAEVSIKDVPTFKTYGDEDFILTGSVTNEGTGGKWTWETSDNTVFQITPNAENAKEATVKILKAGSATITAKYESDTTVGTQTTNPITVNPKPSPAPQPSGSGKTNPTVTAPTAKDLTYTGQAQELVNAGKADGGTMEYALGTDDKTAPTTGWSTTVPTGKDAGNYFVWYRVKGDASHNDVAAKCVPATIAADKEVADVISKIDALPEKDKVQESDKAAIEAARAAYDALTDEEKAQVPADELKKLTDAEEALKAFEPEQPTVYMRAHVENRGWDAKTTPIGPGTSDYVGTTGQGLRLEAFDMVVPENYKVTGFAHVQNVGDSNVTKVDNPEYDVPKGYTVYRFGTTGRALRMEAAEIHLLDENDKPVEGFQYASHLENIGWEGYVNNGSFTGTRHQSRRLEALRFAYPEADAADTQQ